MTRLAVTVNAGSSSVRLALWVLEPSGPRRMQALHLQRAESTASEALARCLAGHEPGEVVLVAHRVVHGGNLAAPSVLDDAVLAEIERASTLAPLHNPASLAWVRDARAFFGSEVEQVAVFDTGFFAGLPEVAKTYALPRELTARHGLRRYGFHGLAHESLWRSFVAQRPALAATGRVVSLQLGSGCSACAIVGGRAVDTSMGLTPLEGLVMGTRSGDLDPGLLIFLQRTGLDADALERMLEQESGLKGVSGKSADMRVLLAASDHDSKLAVALWCYRARKYLGAFLAALGGAEAVLVGGGVGENSPEVRSRVLGGMDWCGLELDPAAIGPKLSSKTSRVEAWVFPVDEETLLIEHAFDATK